MTARQAVLVTVGDCDRTRSQLVRNNNECGAIIDYSNQPDSYQKTEAHTEFPGKD